MFGYTCSNQSDIVKINKLTSQRPMIQISVCLSKERKKETNKEQKKQKKEQKKQKKKEMVSYLQVTIRHYNFRNLLSAVSSEQKGCFGSHHHYRLSFAYFLQAHLHTFFKIENFRCSESFPR